MRIVTASTPPEGTGWEPWTAARAPEAQIWVNEERREMLIIEGGAERRIGAPDAAGFALEVAELERYYDASPKASGGRDACAMLTQPPRCPAEANGAGAAALVVFIFAGGVAGNVLLGALPGDNMLAVVYAEHDTGPASKVGKVPWSEWAEQRGSVQLRDAIQAGVDSDRLFHRDIARAITPEISGTARCATGVLYDRTLEIEYDAARSIFLRARTVAEEVTGQFPVGSTIRAEPPIGCWIGDSAATCVPVELTRGEYSVRTCYQVEQRGPQ